MAFTKIICYLFLLTLSYNLVSAQDRTSLLKGKIKNDSTDEYMSSVHVLNLNSVEGVISDSEGNFEIAVKAKDTLYFSYLGFKPLKVPVSNDMVKLGIPIFRLTQLSFALEEVIVRPYSIQREDLLFPVFHNRDTRLEIEINLQFLKRLDHCLILLTFYITFLEKIQNK